MPRKRKGRGPYESEAEDFVPAVVARSHEEAEEYRELLNDHDIPAILQTDEEEPPGKAARARPPGVQGISRGVAVLVPEAMLDEASEIIADREYDDIKVAEDRGEDEDEEEEELGLEPLEEPSGDGGPKLPKPSKREANPFDDEDDAFELEEEEEEEKEPLAGAEEDIEEDEEDEEGEEEAE